MLSTLSCFVSGRLATLVGVALVTALSTGAGPAHASSSGKTPPVADVEVSQAWIRATVKGQMGTGGFMTLTSSKGATLLGFHSAVAKTNQVHEMAMDGDVMRMRELPSLPLPAGQAVTLKPGGYHLMLINLKKTLQVGDQVPLTLKLKDAKGRVYTQKVQVPVQAMPTATGAESAKEPGHMHH